jgi:hypothetical protein
MRTLLLAAAFMVITAQPSLAKRKTSAQNKKAAQAYCKKLKSKKKGARCAVKKRVCGLDWKKSKAFRGKGADWISCVPSKRGHASAQNKRLANDYCKVFRKKFPKKQCKVDKGWCPKGYIADKSFKGKGQNYSACIKGSKLKNLKRKLTFRKANQGRAELVNTVNCNAKQIMAINTSLRFARKNWKAIKTETMKPSSARKAYFADAYNGIFAGKGAIAYKANKRQWKRLWKLVGGKKGIQIQCRSESWCDKRGVYGRDGIKIRHVNVCVDSIIDEKDMGYLAGNLVHEMGHSANFDPSAHFNPVGFMKHNCKTKKYKGNKCPRNDGVHQVGRAVDFLFSTQSTRKAFLGRVKTARPSKSHCVNGGKRK